MRKLLPFSGILIILIANSCSPKSYRTPYSPVKASNPKANTESTGNSSISQTEREYQTLLKTYKSETAAVLSNLLNDSSDEPTTAITVENNSRCNMVLTISGNNYYKKIPIGVGKIGSAMVLKNQNYNLSGMLCNSVYQKTKFVTTSYNIKLTN